MSAGYYDSALVLRDERALSTPDPMDSTPKNSAVSIFDRWTDRERFMGRGNDGRSNAGTSWRGSKEARSKWLPFNSPSTLMLVIIREDCSQSLVLHVLRQLIETS